MAKKKLYLFSLFVATMSVLLSTVVMHHHHMGRICMVVERCQQDGNFNDEHTEHHEKEADSCRVHQLQDRKSTRLNSSHCSISRMPSSA